MKQYSFRVHYRNDPRRIGHLPMDAIRLADALREFREALPRHIDGTGMRAEFPEPINAHASALRVVLHSALDWEKVALAMRAAADRYGLCATHIAVALHRYAPVPASAGALPVSIA